jgi:hypothetical protein
MSLTAVGVCYVVDNSSTERGASGRVAREFAGGRQAGDKNLVQTSLGELDPELAAVAWLVSHLQRLQFALAAAAMENEALCVKPS